MRHDTAEPSRVCWKDISESNLINLGSAQTRQAPFL